LDINGTTMGLTKPRAAQIFNLDYKQSTRVVTATDITLSGGAPSVVDSVNLVKGDRILVTGQITGSQNGLYLVTTLGSGANGTWDRTSDGNENGEIEAGMIVMVTEGAIYADTQWKLITDDPIVINTTALTFTQNYMANSISGGTSNVVVNSNANVTISSAGTANVLLISSTGTVTSGTGSVTGNIIVGNVLTGGTVSATGNITGSYILGNGSQLTGLPATYTNANVVSLLADFGSNTISTTGNISAGYFLGNVACASGIFSSRIFNGTSEANIGASGGNVNVSVGGTSNVAVFATTGQFVTGLLSVTGNVASGNLNTAGNVTGGNILTGGIISATGNITGNNILGNGAGLSGINVFSNVTVTGGNSAVADSIADTLTLTAGTGIAIVVDSATDTITIAASGGSEIFVDGADFGTVTEPVTLSDDLGLVTDAVTAESDLGTLVTSGLIYPDQFVLPSYTTSTLPSAAVAGAMIYVTNETGGPVPAFADGTNWRRVTDRAIVT
jgi:hypothetical protein